jgi:hypothetical protein
VTFSKDIAPILFQHCASCHRPRQAAPFNLLDYRDATKHAKEIVEVTRSGYMPPWPPEPGYGEFTGARHLSAKEIALLQSWVDGGMVEGNPADLPPTPQWPSDWQLGKPDLVVTLPRAYTLPAEGKDVYRNFVVPVPISGSKYVSALEFLPNNKSVHHGFIKVDRTGQSALREAQGGGPGFPGMSVPAEMPGGHFLSWQPGKTPAAAPRGLAWVLEKGNDLVLQLHMRTTGKAEQVQPMVGLYFTDQAPTNKTFKIVLTSLAIDIPAGRTNYVVNDSYVLPVDVQLLAILPHAHYLAREVRGTARLPDGSEKPLIWIKKWDFNWQGDYRYAEPISLPKGTRVSMRFSFDNSTNNLNNPHHPPRQVTYGPQTTDEMAELWLQLLPRNAADLEILTRDFNNKNMQVLADNVQFRLKRNPQDVQAHKELGTIMIMAGRPEAAEESLRTAVRLSPANSEAHRLLANALQQLRRDADALVEYQEAIRLDPQNFKAHGSLGMMNLIRGKLDEAKGNFGRALEINPADTNAQTGLRLIEQSTPPKAR